MLGFRPSAMDRAVACPASVHPAEGEILVDTVSKAAQVGSAAHDVLEKVVKGEEYSLDEICAEHGVEPSDVGYLQHTCYKFMDYLNGQYDVQEWHSEQQNMAMTEPFELEGTPDIWGLTQDGTTVVVADLKTGRVSRGYEHQMRSYANLVRLEAPEAEQVHAIILWARDLEIEPYVWTTADLDEWCQMVNEKVIGWNGVSYTIGDHCTFCKRRCSCEAKRKHDADGLSLIVRDGGELTDKQFGHAWETSKEIIKKIEAWRSSVRQVVEAEGSKSLGDGKMLTMAERKGKARIDTQKARAVLETKWQFTVTDILSCAKMSKSAMEKVVVERADKGMKGKDKKAVIEDLKEAGALTQGTERVLKVVKEEK